MYRHALRLIRPVVALLLCAVLAACDAPQAPPSAEQRRVVANVVTVDMSTFVGIEGRQIDKSADQVAGDVSRALTNRLAATGAAKPTADVDIQLSSVRLTSRGAAFAFGGPSRVIGVVTVRDVQDGTVVFGPRRVEAASSTLRLPGVVGVATSPSVEDDYRQSIAGFAAAVEQLLNGPEGPGIGA
ncbi:hypothetical protein [Tateyamaria sp. SN6-1]|uniref:hypothetical protein n=1 Tax=Tateyamaria sp. SN6-1 TaxID=3092148 RepID=UPI0039F4521F